MSIDTLNRLRPVRREEHPARDPDGVPHDVIGMTALVTVLFALFLGVIWTGGGAWAMGGVGVIGLVVLVRKMATKSKRERRQENPDRPDLQE